MHFKICDCDKFSQLHLSRRSSSRQLLEQINLHSIAVYTRWLIREAKKMRTNFESFCRKGKFHVKDMHRSVSFFFQLFLWRLAKISKFVLCTAQTFISLWVDCLISLLHGLLWNCNRGGDFRVKCRQLVNKYVPVCDTCGLYKWRQLVCVTIIQLLY